MIIPVPSSSRKRALIVVDVQPKTLKGDLAYNTVDLITKFIRATKYDFYIIATYDAPSDSMLFKQSKWLLTPEQGGTTDSEVIMAVGEKETETLEVTKTVRSVLKCRENKILVSKLKEHSIEEVHLVWFDINDCVLWTAYDAIDSGYYTYVIEECCNHHSAYQRIVDSAITVLRQQNMTNHSTLFSVTDCEIVE